MHAHDRNRIAEKTGHHHMTRNHRAHAASVLSAGLLAAALSGCTIGPVELPDIPLDFLDRFVTTATVADAEQSLKDARTSTVDSSELVSEGTLTVGLLSTASAPFVGTTSSGNQVGVNIELAYALADQLGLDVQFVDVTDAATSLGATCDVVVGVSTSEGGATAGVSVMGDYAETAVGVFAKKGSGIASVSDLAGKTAGVQPGSSSERALAETGASTAEQSFANTNEAMDALEDGSVDFVVCDAYAGSYLACKGYDDVELVGTLDIPVAIGVAVRADKPTLAPAVQAAVDAVQTNGQLDVIKARWVNGIETLTANSRLQGAGVTATVDAADAAAATADAAATTDAAADGTATTDGTPAE